LFATVAGDEFLELGGDAFTDGWRNPSIRAVDFGRAIVGIERVQSK